METDSETRSWFGPGIRDSLPEPGNPGELIRLWGRFMTARATLGLVLVILQGVLYALGQAQNPLLLVICGAYFVATVAVRLLTRPRQLGYSFDPQWLAIIGVDVLAFATLQFVQGSNINYAPLFALPVLLASVLGSLPLALGTAATVTLLLLTDAVWHSLRLAGDATSPFVQAALTGAGCFVIAFLAHQIALRVASEEQRARRSQLAARIQGQVNELVIETLNDGVLVVDALGTVRAANPAARRMLGSGPPAPAYAFDLASETAWQSLAELNHQSFVRSTPVHADIVIRHSGKGPRHIHVRTRLTATPAAESLCVMFLQDQREIEARARTEKLASMGRMSAAVAHEIRNPLAAIAQANALLDEDLKDPRQRQLTMMVRQNAKRLEKIVDDVLNFSRVHQGERLHAPQPLALNDSVARICRDWQQQTQTGALLLMAPSAGEMEVSFETEHLRRVLINLLDNARRYASGSPDCIQVSTRQSARQRVALGVWSEGPPMEPSVERHLFEPFFSSESRSSGLGLYISRELCEGHGASISYVRSRRVVRGSSVEGNEFVVSFRPLRADVKLPAAPDRANATS